jgi:hypothetical protein
VRRLSRKRGGLEVSQPHRSPQLVTSTALIFFFFFNFMRRNRLKVFEKKILRRIFQRKEAEVTGE